MRRLLVGVTIDARKSFVELNLLFVLLDLLLLRLGLVLYAVQVRLHDADVVFQRARSLLYLTGRVEMS